MMKREEQKPVRPEITEDEARKIVAELEEGGYLNAAGDTLSPLNEAKYLEKRGAVAIHRRPESCMLCAARDENHIPGSHVTVLAGRVNGKTDLTHYENEIARIKAAREILSRRAWANAKRREEEIKADKAALDDARRELSTAKEMTTTNTW